MTRQRRHRGAARVWVALAASLAAWPAVAVTQEGAQRQTPPDLAGVYQVIADDTILPGGLRNSGSPRGITLLPAGIERMKGVDPAQDPTKLCQPVGPFRKMARPHMKFELVPALARGMIVLLFEDVSRGHMRTVFLKRGHPDPVPFTWHGDSIGRWQGDTLVIDTIGLNERTWLNDAGAQHSKALHLVERIRPILKGRYLEYTVTAEDAAVLAKPYTYTRYFEKLQTEIMEDVCEP